MSDRDRYKEEYIELVDIVIVQIIQHYIHMKEY